MGQYYKPVILGGKDKKTVKSWMYSHDYKNGLKLMEHSWIGNEFVAAFEGLILDNPQRIVWGGDYADHCKGRKSNVYSRCFDEDDKGKVSTKVSPTRFLTSKESRFVINHTKKLFVDKNKCLKSTFGWKIHPLPLLTSEGNGQGGGDFWGNDENNLVGSWARDLVSVSSKKPKGFTELKFDLVEK